MTLSDAVATPQATLGLTVDGAHGGCVPTLGE